MSKEPHSSEATTIDPNWALAASTASRSPCSNPFHCSCVLVADSAAASTLLQEKRLFRGLFSLAKGQRRAVKGVGTNSRPLYTIAEGDCIFGPAAYVPDLGYNLLSISTMYDAGLSVRYDSTSEDVFLLTTVDGEDVRFLRAKPYERLYTHTVCLDCADRPVQALVLEAPRILDRPEQANEFEEGEQVEAKWKGRALFFRGRITGVHLSAQGSKTYDIDYEDGDRETRVPSRLIRRLQPQIQRSELTASVDGIRLERAHRARNLHVWAGHPSDRLLTAGLKTIYADEGLSQADFDLAQQLLGKCQACHAGKMVHRPARRDPLPAEEPGTVQHVDVVFVQAAHGKRDPYFFSVDGSTGAFHSISMPRDFDHNDMTASVLALAARYYAVSWRVKWIKMDRESTVRPALTGINAQGIQLRQEGAGQHEKTAEAGVRTVRDRMRAIQFSVSHRIPARLFKFLWSYAVKKCNQLPNAKTGNHSPEWIIDRRKPYPNDVVFGRWGYFVEPSRGTGQQPASTMGMVVDVDLSSPRGSVCTVFFPEKETTGIRTTDNEQVAWVIPDKTVISMMNALAKRDCESGSFLILDAEGQLIPESDNGLEQPADPVEMERANSILRDKLAQVLKDEKSERRRVTDAAAAKTRERTELKELERLSERQLIAPPQPPTGTADGRAYSTGAATRSARAAARGQDRQEAPADSAPHVGVAPAGSNRAPAGSASYEAAPAGSGASHHREAPTGSLLQGAAPVDSNPTPADRLLYGAASAGGLNYREAPAGSSLQGATPADSDPAPADSAGGDSPTDSDKGVQDALTALLESAQRTVALQHFVAEQIGAEAPVTPALVVNHLDEAAERAICNVLYRGTGLAHATQPELEALVNVSMRNLTKSAEGRDGLKGELKQLIDYDCLKPRHYAELSTREKENVAFSHAFGKHKPATEQTEARFKVRNVIHGNKVKYSAVTNVSSPCVRMSSLFMTFAILAAGHKLDSTYNAEAHDIKGAYLQTAMPESKGVVPIILGFRGAQKEILFELEPAFKEFDDSPDGVFYAQATQAVYGIGEAGLLWYNHLRIVLTKKFVFPKGQRLRSLESDPCVYMLVDDGEIENPQQRMLEEAALSMLEEGMAGHAGDAQALALTLERIKAAGLEMPSLVATWVDDLFTIGRDSFLDAFRSQLQASFPAGIVTQRLSDQSSIEYVSMRIAYEPNGKGLTLDQERMIRDFETRYGVTGRQKYPSDPNIFEADETSAPLDGERLKRYQSATMAALYVHRLTRADGLLPNSWLASRMHCATEQDESKLNHLLEYLVGSADLKMCINPESLQLEGKVDAAYAVHQDARGQHGIIVSMQNMGGTVVVRSVKQRLVSRSSTQAEFIGLHDAGPHFVECKNFMDEVGLTQEPIEVEQDNTASIQFGNEGREAAKKSRHMNVRYFWVKQLVDDGVIRLKYCPTELMLADMLTKSTSGSTFFERRSRLLGWG